MEVMGAPPPGRDTLSQLRLPPGFRFYPTDEELLVQYLCRKVAGYNFSLQVIGEIDLYKFDPWVLPSKAIFGEKEWYFFSPRDRKYPNGSRPNRVAGSGYWKATGTDKVITTQGRRVGIKKALVFYVGKAPKGTKTNWIMHEYRLVESVARRPNSSSTKLDDWVLCRIYKKTSGGGGARVTDFDTGIAVASSPMNFQQYNNSSGISNSESSSSSHMEEVMESIPEINDDGFFSFPRIITNLKIEPQQFSSPPPQMKFPPPSVVSQPTTATMHHHHVPPPQPVSAMGAQKQQPLQQEAEDNHNNSKLGLLYSFGSGSIDWNALIGLTSSGPDDLSSLGLGESGISPQQQQQSSILTDHDEADMCVPSLPPLCHVGDSPPQHKLSLLSDKRVQIKNDNQEQGQNQNGWFGGGGYLGNGGGGGQDNPFERRFDCSNQMAGLYGLRQ